MFRWFLSTFFTLIFLMFSFDVNAAVGINEQIPFVGTLRDSDGNALSGSYDMVFTIYDSPTAGSVLWSGEYTVSNGNPVVVDDGVFRVLLGSGIGNTLTLDFNDDSYYLGIRVGSDPEMTPREHLGASGYAFNADKLDGYDAVDFLLGVPPVALAGTTSDALFGIRQNGGGSALSVLNGGDEVFTVRADGSLYSVASGESVFEGPIELADNGGLWFGSGSGGIQIYQDVNGDGGPSDLLLVQRSPALKGDGINIDAEGKLTLYANVADWSYSPFIELSDTGLVTISNAGFGGTTLYVNNGVEVDGDSIFNDSLTLDSLAGSGVNTICVNDSGVLTYCPSDRRFKKNIRPIIGALDLVEQMNGVRYEWKDEKMFGDQTEVGFVAQDLETVLPEVVRDNGNFLSVQIQNVVAVVVEAVKELKAEVSRYFVRTEKLEDEVSELRREIELLKKGKSTSRAETELVENIVSTEDLNMDTEEEDGGFEVDLPSGEFGFVNSEGEELEGGEVVEVEAFSEETSSENASTTNVVE